MQRCNGFVGGFDSALGSRSQNLAAGFITSVPQRKTLLQRILQRDFPYLLMTCAECTESGLISATPPSS